MHTHSSLLFTAEAGTSPISARRLCHERLMRPNKAETAVIGCHCPGDMAVRMRKVLARPWVQLVLSASLAFIVGE